MSESIETARHHLTLPPVWRRSLCLLGLTLALLLTVYTLAGFFLAPYLVTRYVQQYAAEQLHLKVHLGQVRINPLLFTCEVKDLSLQIDEEEPFFSVHRIFIDFEPETLFRRVWTFADLAIESPALHLVIGPDGRLNLAKLAERVPKAEAQPNAEKKSPPRLLLKHLALSAGTVQVADHSKALPTDTTIEPINLEFNNISTLPEQLSTYTVSASIPDGGTLGWQGEMTLQPISATGTIDIKDFKPAAIWNHFRDRLNLAEPTGTAQLTASYHFSTSKGEAALLLNPLSLSLHGLSLTEKGASQPLLKLGSLTASGGQIDFVTHRIVFPSIMLKGGRVAALVDKTGLGNWQRLLKQGTKSPAPKNQNTQAKPTGNETLPWQIGVKAFSATDLDLHYSDANRATPITLDANLAMSLAEGSLDLGRQEASIKRIALTGGGITLTQTPVGAVTAADHQKTRPETRQETNREETSARKRPWKLALDQLSVSGFHLGFADQKRKPPLAYDLTDLRAEVTDLSSIGEKPIAFEAQAGIRQGGSASLAGTMSQADGQIGQIEAQVAIAQLNLKPLESLIAQHAALTLASGDLTANTHLRYATGSPPSSLTVEGEAKIGTLLLNEEDTGKRFLAWKELAANGLEFGLNPDHLAIKELRLQDPGAKITIFKDKSFNLIKILRQKDEAETEKTEKPPFPVEIERVRLKNGVVDFADLSLVLPFSTRITEVKGAASGISTKPSTHTSLKFEGRVGEFGQAKANGSLAPANPKQFTDIKVSFRNVAMSPLSPYSATFAGRNIASGKLNLDLGYNIKDSELLGENSVILKDFTLGEHVESPSAMDLPLDLAIALLTDGEGRIDIAVPIRGNIDHPEFSYGHVFRQALFNLLTKVVTAPFRALAALFGSHSENMDTILFEPGRVELAPPEQEKLKNVAEALGKRTQLQLTVHGGFEPGLDGKALKTSQFRRILVQKFGVQPGPLTFDNAKTQRALEKLAGDKLAPFQTGYEEISGKKAKRVNPALALFGKGSEDYAFYQALYEYLIETAPLAQDELATLAEKRGLEIVKELTDRFGIEAARITLGPAVQTEEQDQTVPAKLELGLR